MGRSKRIAGEFGGKVKLPLVVWRKRVTRSNQFTNEIHELVVVFFVTVVRHASVPWVPWFWNLRQKILRRYPQICTAVRDEC